MQFPAYMSRIQGRQLSPTRAYEIPNLTLFPNTRREPSPNTKKQIESGVIQKVSVLSSSGLPSVHKKKRKNGKFRANREQRNRPGFRLKKQSHDLRPLQPLEKGRFPSNISIEDDDLTFKLSQTDCASSNSNSNSDNELFNQQADQNRVNSSFLESKTISFQAPITIDSSFFAIIVGGAEPVPIPMAPPIVMNNAQNDQ